MTGIAALLMFGVLIALLFSVTSRSSADPSFALIQATDRQVVDVMRVLNALNVKVPLTVVQRPRGDTLLLTTPEFDAGSAELTKMQIQRINDVLPLIQGTKGVLEVRGSADGTPIRRSKFDSNDDLAWARARSVTKYLTERKVAQDRIRVSIVNTASVRSARPVADQRVVQIVAMASTAIELRGPIAADGLEGDPQIVWRSAQRAARLNRPTAPDVVEPLLLNGKSAYVLRLSDLDGSRCSLSFDASTTGGRRFTVHFVNMDSTDRTNLRLQCKEDVRFQLDRDVGSIVGDGDAFTAPRGTLYMTERTVEMSRLTSEAPYLVLLEEGMTLESFKNALLDVGRSPSLGTPD